MKQLLAWGVDVECVGTAAAALARLREHALTSSGYRILLIDPAVPGRICSELVAAVRADAALAQVKLVLLSPPGEARCPNLGSCAIDARLPRQAGATRLLDCIRFLLDPDAQRRRWQTRQELPEDIAVDKAGIRILVVEDNLVNQKVATMLLQRGGYGCDLATNGSEACDMVAARTYDLVFMDCQMPVMDGFDATRMIRAAEEGGERRLPIIAMTANAFAEDRERCLAAGMDDYVSKPVDPQELYRLVRRWASEGSDVSAN